MSQTLPPIEVFNSENFFIFVRNEHCLWWDRSTGTFFSKPVNELPLSVAPQCIGVCYGIIGKLSLPSVPEPKVLVIKQCSDIGNGIFKINNIAFLQPDTPFLLNACPKHQNQIQIERPSEQRSSPFAKTLGAMRTASNTIKSSTQQAARIISRDNNKLERRMVDELLKIFNDTDSFYFSIEHDLTNSVGRQCKSQPGLPSWRTVDERFFWNKHMAQDIIRLESPHCDPWVLPIIQGFVEKDTCKLQLPNDDATEVVELSVISRRSRHRAGTRYKRRGVDDDGHCANYVETEQILRFQHHAISFLQVRGSVPVFWSQPGYKYRPPPTLLKGPTETQPVFNKHFEHEQSIYGSVVVVNLVEQNGKERVIWDAYTNHMMAYNHPQITYCTFDFHEYCRGMRFENVNVLTEAVREVVRGMGYCWADRHGLICEQTAVFRVNCIDCLDRTNVVQTALGKMVLEMQLTKLGLLTPEGQLPAEMRVMFQKLWADNGDIISRQYAGTNALKGDFTRTGERKFTGMMKDGMNSANRYYQVHLRDGYRQAALDVAQGLQPEPIEFLNKLAAETREVVGVASAVVPKSAPDFSSITHVALAPEMRFAHLIYLTSRYYLSRFKDAYRQATIDMMLGHEVSEEVFADKAADDEDGAATAEHVKLLLDDCKKLLINDPSEVLACWGLIDADPVTGDPSETEMDTVLIVTKYAYYVAEYDEQVDRVSKYQRVSLRDVQKIEVGASGVSAPLSVFKRQLAPHCLRVHYVLDGDSGYFHTFRSAGLRFFNNVTVQITSPEEMLESLKAVSETFLVALEVAGLPPVPVTHGKPLERLKSKTLTADNTCRLGSYLDVRSCQSITRNVSETQLVNLKTAGTKALSNISQQFSKMGRLGQSFRHGGRAKPKQVVKAPVFSIEQVGETSPSSSDSSESASFYEAALKGRDARSRHWHLDSAGLLMTDAPRRTPLPASAAEFPPKSPLHHAKTQAAFATTDLVESARKAQAKRKPCDQLALADQSNLSWSSELFDSVTNDKAATPTRLNLELPKRSSSEKNLTLNLASSQSELTLRSIRTNLASVITSPSSATQMLSPLSKLAKGVHTFSATLDPRKLKSDTIYKPSDAHLEEVKALQDRWASCSVQLIAL